MTLAAALAFHTPDSAAQAAVLACASVTTVLAGRRAVGDGFGWLTAALALTAFAIVGNVAIPLAGAAAALALLARARFAGLSGRRPAGPLALQLLLVLGGLALYTAGRFIVESDAASALSTTGRLIDFERSLGLYLEPDLQSWVLRSQALTRIVNWVYSFGFLAIVAASLLWLWVTDEPNYRLLRNSLGISVLLALPTIALFPAAPPRLTPDAGIIDTIALMGREHAFANEYAAIPSLHVGWMAAVGLVLGRSAGGWRGAVLLCALGPLMLFTVIATGNHFWIDGVVGAAFTAGPALLLSPNARLRRSAARTVRVTGSAARAIADAALQTWVTLGENRRALFSFLSLGGLLAYLLIAQRLTPGFTDFWGYLSGQVAVFLVLLVGGEVVFARQGGLSWLTHGVAVFCAFADVLGTDGNLYAQIGPYDKLTHFAGVAAFTAGIYDCLRCLSRRGDLAWPAMDRLMWSIAVGVAIGVGWEGYEFLGDKVFNSARVNGRWDTANDIVSDTLGALSVGLLLWWAELHWVRAEAGFGYQGFRGEFEGERVAEGTPGRD